MSATIEQLKRAIHMNDALYNKVSNGEISINKAGSLFESQVSSVVNEALKMALEELTKKEEI